MASSLLCKWRLHSFRVPGTLQGGVNDANYFYIIKTNYGNSLELNCKTSNLIDISMYTQNFLSFYYIFTIPKHEILSR